jgi:hypothetical protein
LVSIIVAILFAGAGFYFMSFMSTNKANQDNKNSTTNTEITFNPKDACDVLDEQIVKTALDENTTKDDAPSSEVSTVDVVVSNCTYTNQTINPRDIKTIGLLLRSAKNTNGASSNKDGFTKNKNRNYGDIEIVNVANSSPIEKLTIASNSAYYDPDMKQV